MTFFNIVFSFSPEKSKQGTTKVVKYIIISGEMKHFFKEVIFRTIMLLKFKYLKISYQQNIN